MNFYGAEKILRLTPLTKNSENIAKNILQGAIQIFPTLPLIKFDAKEQLAYSVLCEMRYPSAESTYALYTYALYPVSYLLNAYEKTGNNIFLEKGIEYTLNFIKWENDSSKKLSPKRINILFGDHSISNRTQALCYLIVCMNKAKIKPKRDIFEYLITQGEYLANEDNYSHYNHGLMMDLSLLGLIKTLVGNNINYPLYFNSTLEKRLNLSLSRDFTLDGVHIENSPGYHFWIVNYLDRITPSLKSFNSELYNKSCYFLDKSKVYASYITRLDGSVPSIGDTHTGLRYIVYSGLETNFFADSDIVVFRNDDLKSWAFFSSGYKTHIHKHEDNGGLNIYYKGEDLLIDPGFLNYEGTEESYSFRNVRSHNTASINQNAQKLQTINVKQHDNYGTNLSASRVISYGSLGQNKYAIAMIAEYEIATVIRLVIFLKSSNFIVYDYILEDYDNNFTLEQYFNLSSKFSVKDFCGSQYLLSSELNPNIYVYNMSNKESISSCIEKSRYVVKFNNYSETQRLVFSTTDRSLCTYIGDDPEEVQKHQDTLLVDGKSIVLQDFILKKLKEESIFLKQSNSAIVYESGERVYLLKGMLKVEAVFKEDTQYAFYLQKDHHIEKVFYKKNNFHDFFISHEGDYTLTFFYRDKNGEKIINKKTFSYNEKDGLVDF